MWLFSPPTICCHNELRTIATLISLSASPLSLTLLSSEWSYHASTQIPPMVPQHTQSKCQSASLIGPLLLTLWYQHLPSATTKLLQPSPDRPTQKVCDVFSSVHHKAGSITSFNPLSTTSFSMSLPSGVCLNLVFFYNIYRHITSYLFSCWCATFH